MRDDLSDVTALLDGFLETARREGRDVLLEPEGLEVARGLGIAVPHWELVPDAGTARGLDLDAFPGAQVVVKVVSASLLHKSDEAGVRFLPKDPRAIEEAVGDMGRQLARHRPRGYMVVEFVPHDPSLGGQVLLGMRYTTDFGPVVTFGPGGVDAEFLARHLRPGRDTAILSPVLATPAHVDAALEATAITPAATGRLRGQASRIRIEDLRGLLLRWLAFARAAMPHALLEYEINPLVWTERGPMALDALARLGRAPTPRAPDRPLHKLPCLLRPRHIAVVGVSERTWNPGRIILQNTLASGFPRERVTVVKPGVDTIDGCRCVPDVQALRERVDLLVVSVDAGQAPDVIADAVAAQKAESLILIAGGLGERVGREAPAEKLQATLLASRGTPWRGPLLNGGNCLGIRSVPGRYDTLFIPRPKLGYPDTPPAPLAIVSQSGAFAVARASKLAALNPRYVITIGNQVDLTVGDYLEGLGRETEVEVFACYVEGFRPGDGERWLAAAAHLTRQGRTVVLYRAGRTPAGARATASHTASIAGDYAVTRALATAAGVLVAETHEEFEDLVTLVCRLKDRRVSGLRLGVLSNAGFECVTIADNLGPFTLASLEEATVARLRRQLDARRLSGVVGVQNPFDVTPIFGDEDYEEATRALLQDANVDVVVVGCVPLSAELKTLPAGAGHDEDLSRAGAVGPRLARAIAASGKAAVVVVDAGPAYDPFAAFLASAGIPVFRTSDQALKIFGRYCRWRCDRSSPDGAPTRPAS